MVAAFNLTQRLTLNDDGEVKFFQYTDESSKLVL